MWETGDRAQAGEGAGGRGASSSPPGGPRGQGLWVRPSGFSPAAPTGGSDKFSSSSWERNVAREVLMSRNFFFTILHSGVLFLSAAEVPGEL